MPYVQRDYLYLLFYKKDSNSTCIYIKWGHGNDMI